MTLLAFKIFIALSLFIIALAGGAWPFFVKFKKNLPHSSYPKICNESLAENFTKGILLGIALFDLLPAAAQIFIENQYSGVYAYIIAGLIVLLLSLVKYCHFRIKPHIQQLDTPCLLTALLLSIHSLLEGSALGLSTNQHIALLLGISILIHKGTVAFALALILTHSQLRIWKAGLVLIGFALMTPLGILLGNSANADQASLLLAIFNTLAATALIYIALLHDLTPNPAKSSRKIKNITFLIIGILLVAVVNWGMV